MSAWRRGYSVERSQEKLSDGTILHVLSDGEGGVYGHLAVQPDGQARLWTQTWVDEYAPTDFVFPGFVSAARAVLAGWV